jgi:hypothetical protein
VKGILNVADAATPVAVHGVQHLVHPPRHLGFQCLGAANWRF